MKRRIIIWGTGSRAKELYNYFCLHKFYCNDKLIAFCDSNEEKQNNMFESYSVISPLKLKEIDFDIVVIANIYINEIIKIVKKYDLCDIKKVYNFEDYIAELYSFEQYYKRYNQVFLRVPDVQTENRITVITAIIGDYDILQEPLYVSENIRYICVTDQDIVSDIWEIHRVSCNGMAEVEMARRIKILPWEYLEINTEYYVWVDAKYKIIDDLRTYIYQYNKSKGLLFFPHPERECICNELAQLILLEKGNKVDMINQVCSYLKDGYPINYGLYETACIVRKTADKLIERIMYMWWREIKKSYRDQLSLPYVLWKNVYVPDICDKNIRKNNWIVLVGHKENGNNL